MGGGIRSLGTTAIINSVVIGNTTSGNGAQGGGISSFGNLTITNSTISGNGTSGLSAEGGGIFAQRNVTIRNSTVTSNSTVGTQAPGGGIAIQTGSGTRILTLDNSILAANQAGGEGPDVIAVPSGLMTISASYSIFGDTNGLTAAQLASINSGIGNLLNVNPLLGPLQNNGGPTPTHALLPGSPAINAGNPAAIAGANGVPSNDQRGIGFPRVSNGRIDIGAFEVGNLGDFDKDGDVDGRDFLVWQRNTSVGLLSNWQDDYSPLVTSADFDSDSDIDGRDFLVWQRGFGTQYDHDDLLAWQGQYGVGGVSAIGSQLSVSHEPSVDSRAFGSGLLALGTLLARETASDDVLMIDDPAPLEGAVDEAFAKIGAPSRSTVHEFGDIAVRRSPSQRAFASDNSNDWLSTLDS